MVGTGFFRFFPAETHVAQTARRSLGSDFLPQTRPDDCCNLSHNWLRPRIYHSLFIEIQRFWLSWRSGRPRTLSKGVERAVEKKMRGKRRRSSRAIARLKKQKVADVSYSTVQRTMHRRDLHAFRQRKASRVSKTHKRGRLRFAQANTKKDDNPRHNCCLGQICW